MLVNFCLWRPWKGSSQYLVLLGVSSRQLCNMSSSLHFCHYFRSSIMSRNDNLINLDAKQLNELGCLAHTPTRHATFSG